MGTMLGVDKKEMALGLTFVDKTFVLGRLNGHSLAEQEVFFLIFLFILFYFIFLFYLFFFLVLI